MLSPGGVAQNNLKEILRLGDEPKIPRKLSVSVQGYPHLRTRAREQKDLQIIADLLIGEAKEWPELQTEFYARCYCKDWTLSAFSLLTKNILTARHEGFFPETHSAPSVSPISKKSLKTVLEDESLLTEALLQRPIILLGEPGVGKTAFLKNLLFIDAAKEIDRTIYIYVDLATRGALSEQLSRFILDDIEQQLRDRYQIDIHDNVFVETLYAEELERFERGIFGSARNALPGLFLQNRIEFLARKVSNVNDHLARAVKRVTSTTSRQLVVVLDNADQRATSIQIEAFAVAQELSLSWGALVFLALRPQTYTQIRQTTSIVGSAQRVFSIPPPRLEEALRRKLLFAVDIAEGRLDATKLKVVRLDLSSFSIVTKALLNGIKHLGDMRSLIGNFFDGNVAEAVDAMSRIISKSPCASETPNRGL